MKLNKKTLIAVLAAVGALVAAALKFAQSLPDDAIDPHGGAPAVEFVAADAGTDAGK